MWNFGLYNYLNDFNYHNHKKMYSRYYISNHPLLN